MSDDERFRTVVRSGLAKEQQAVSRGPDFDDLDRRAHPAPPRHRPSGFLVAALAALVTIVTIGGAALLRNDHGVSGATPAFDLAAARAQATSWWDAVIAADLDAAIDIAHPDASFNYPGLAELIDSIGRPLTVTIGVDVLGSGDQPQLCYTLTGSAGTRQGSLVFRRSAGSWRVWEIRPQTEGCTDKADVTTTQPETAAPLPTYQIGDHVLVATDCPAADPLLRSSIGDGLPRKGQTDRERVERILEGTRDDLIATFGATDIIMVPRNGQVWAGPGNGDYTIEDALDYQLRVTLGPESPCPQAPFLWEGIPVEFVR
jgi:hypothetical protein